MRIVFFILITFSIIACSKDNDKDVDVPPPPPAIDTLKSGWKKIQITTSAHISDIFFTNSTIGYAVAGNEIFRSTDGGNQWSKVYQSNKRFYNISMGNENNAIFLSPSKVIFYTNNGGISFDSIELADKSIDDAFFVSESIAYAVGRNTWKTVNAGKSWTALSAFTPDGDTDTDTRALFFWDQQTGWITSNGFFKTANGGVTWSNTQGFGLGLGNIFFVSATNGYISDPNSIYKTLDGGASFIKVFSTYTSSYHDIHFVDPQKGYITDGKYIWKTIDSGQTWTKEVVLAQGDLVELHFSDVSHGWAAGLSGLILKYEP